MFAIAGRIVGLACCTVPCGANHDNNVSPGNEGKRWQPSELLFHKPSLVIDAGGGGLFGLVRKIAHF